MENNPQSSNQPNKTPTSSPQIPIKNEPQDSSNKPLIVTIIVLIFIILGLISYFIILPLFNKNTNNDPNSTTTSQNTQNSPKEETEITDETKKSALFDKLFTLHIPTASQKDYSQFSDFSKNKSFEFRGGFSVNENFYPDASDFSAQDKLYIVTQYINYVDTARLSKLSDLNIPSNYYATKFQDYCSASPSIECQNAEIPAITAQNVADVYLEIFGEKITNFRNPTPICGGYFYDSDYSIFIQTIQACGGADPLAHHLYIEKYTELDNLAYIYIRLNSTQPEDTSNGDSDIIVYRAFLKHSDFYNPITQTHIIPDKDLIFTTTKNEESTFISDANYENFEPYRFVFEKDSAGNYYFQTVEKL